MWGHIWGHYFRKWGHKQICHVPPQANPRGVVFAFHKLQGKRSVSAGAMWTFCPTSPSHQAGGMPFHHRRGLSPNRTAYRSLLTAHLFQAPRANAFSRSFRPVSGLGAGSTLMGAIHYAVVRTKVSSRSEKAKAQTLNPPPLPAQLPLQGHRHQFRRSKRCARCVPWWWSRPSWPAPGGCVAPAHDPAAQAGPE